MNAAMRKRLCLLLALIGLATSAYLLHRSFVLMEDARPESQDVCSAMFGSGCDETLLDKSSWVLGIPLAGWGVVYYVTLAALLIMAMALGDAFAPQAMAVSLVVALAGLTNSAVLATGMMSGASAFCPLCMLIHVINLLLAPAVFWAGARGVRPMLAEFGAGVAYVLGRKATDPAAAAWKVVGLLLVALIAVVAYQWVYVQTVARQAAKHSPADAPEDVLANFLAQPVRSIDASAEDARLGPPGAAAEMVVFSDFQCPHCARFADVLRELRQRHQDKLAIVFKHFPLSTACDPALKVDLHPRSCQLAWAAEAAHRQGKFWEFHDAVFASGDSNFDDAAIDALAGKVGLDLDQFASDVRSATVKSRIEADITQGREVGVRGTPTAFLNGRRVTSRELDSLELLIEHELRPHD